ncbi:hypothetical protein SAMN05661012_04023 [Chitinophaga sancti]|uniref:Uncharacterized protein n=1 Tax=Chitinophaga sancti TaxID=1004 RepID=A0A1K1RPB6_9BACT|nr:hypothetical protein SAMN05661012_04023 [Chitinophaga sancti]
MNAFVAEDHRPSIEPLLHYNYTKTSLERRFNIKSILKRRSSDEKVMYQYSFSTIDGL